MEPQSNGPAPGPGLTPNAAGLLCYVLGAITGILFLVIPSYNESSFVRFHAFQSILLHFACILGWIMYYIFLMAFWPIILTRSTPSAFDPTGYILVVWGTLALSLFFLLFYWCFLMYKAFHNQRCHFPGLGRLAAKLASGTP